MAALLTEEVPYNLDDVLNESHKRPKHAALHSAIRRSRVEEVEALVSADHRVLEVPDLTNKRALHVACSGSGSSEDIVKYLLDSGAKANTVCIDKMSPLLLAVASGAGANVVELLLGCEEGKETIEWTNKSGETAVQVAFDKKRVGAARALCVAGAKLSPACVEAATRSLNDDLKALAEEYCKSSSSSSSSGDDADASAARVSPPPLKKQRPQEE
jgi:ankyrin repeat protein